MTAAGFNLTPITPDLSAGVLDCKGDTLLLPTVSIGSVPQLAFDLLVHAPQLGLERVARVQASWCVPFAGPLDSVSTPSPAEAEICTAMELYRSAKLKLTLLHQRSPVLKSQKDQFIASLLTWIEQQGFSQVLLVSSLDAGLRVDQEFNTPLVHWSSAPTSTGLVHFVTSSTPAFTPIPLPGTQPKRSLIPPLPGSGLTRRLLSAAQSRKLATPLAALLLFAGEGDNRGDAHALAGLLSRGLGVPGEEEFREPVSWQSLFGPKYDQALYG